VLNICHDLDEKMYICYRLEEVKARLAADKAAKALTYKVRYNCECGGVYKLRSEECHKNSLMHRHYVQSLSYTVAAAT